MRKLVFLFVLFATFGVVARAADVTFKASAPEAVVMGETFRLSYTVKPLQRCSDRKSVQYLR